MSQDAPTITSATPPDVLLGDSAVVSRPRIQRLELQLVNQIAAGEVVVRPAAAVKELVENALDAGATRLEIAIEEDVLGFSVRDDGSGMDEEDLLLSIERHATSKIREWDDLQRLSTRGFRGEALAAIAAVSRLEIVTRRRGASSGLRLRASGGHDPRATEFGAPDGTTVTVRDLFYNTPARLKFMKNAVAEWGHILQTIVRQSLTRPDVAFAIRWRGKPYLTLPANQSLRDRLAQILPAEAANELIELDTTLHDVRVTGAVTGPRATRRDRRHQYYFANERPIFFRPLQFAMEEAFRGLIMTQRYPMGAILITLPADTLDVNVHPTKEEVRFRNEALVSGAVHRAAVEALRGAELVPQLFVDATQQAPAAMSTAQLIAARDSAVASGAFGASAASGTSDAPFVNLKRSPIAENPTMPPLQMDGGALSGAEDAADSNGRQLDFIPGFGLADRAASREAQPNAASSLSNFSAADSARPTAAYAEPHAREEASLIARLRAAAQPPRALAQISSTYILADAGEVGMLVIDQHAAHEKILYLQVLREMESPERRIEVQPLLIPHSIDLAPSDYSAMDALLPALHEAGFDVEPFGGGTYLVQALPVLFDRLDVPAFLRDLLDDMGQGDTARELRRLRERICARAACRAAVKSGDPLSMAELQRLVDQLLHTEDSLRCPHGRPTMLLMTRDSMDRQFGRI